MNTRTATNAARTSTTSTSARPALTNAIAAKYLPRVQFQAMRIARKLPRHISVGDLVSAGFLGLIDAFSRFDTGRVESLDAYVDHRIRGAIFDELRRHDPLSRDQRVFARRYSSARHTLCNRLGRAPEETELAAEMEMPLAQFRTLRCQTQATSARPAASVNLIDEALGVPANDCPEETTSAREERAMVSAAIDRLTPRHRDVMRMHYDEGRTLREIGAVLGVTESRVSQIHSQAVVALRASLVEAPVAA